MRLFIGIPLESVVVDKLSSYTRQLKVPGDEFKWADPSGWHITLQFLGSTSAEQYSCLRAELLQVKHRAFEVNLETPDFFERSGVFFIGVRTTPELVRLQHRVFESTRLCGFAPEARTYHPHITLARFKPGSKGLSNLKQHIRDPESFGSYIAREFTIYESTLTPSGSKFEVRGSVRLTSK